MKHFFLFLYGLSLVVNGFSQKKIAQISGIVLDENGKEIPNVSIVMLGQRKGIISSDSGTFQLSVPAEKSFALIFSHTNFSTLQKNFFLNRGEVEHITLQLIAAPSTLAIVIVRNEKERKESSLITLDPRNALLLPGATGGIESMIKTMVGSNNELTSQYNVRGGNYDENIIYINDFELYRPYLVSNGQQEGLSFINPELVKNVSFYTGGFQAKYGDKMSSVLDIQYKKNNQPSGSAYASLLEQGVSFTGSKFNNKLLYTLGVRNKSNSNLLKTQPTLGAYIPSASDFQSLISCKVSPKIQLELLTILTGSSFTFFPESVKKTSAVFSPLFTASLGLDTYFEGKEKDQYQSGLIGATCIHQVNPKLKLKWLVNQYSDNENENFDIKGAYLFGDRDFDNTSSTYGEIINPLGAGVDQQYGRNHLSIKILNGGHRGSLEMNQHFFQWGGNIERVTIKDALHQFEYQDSAGYSLPYSTSSMQLYNSLFANNHLSFFQYSGFIQDNIHLIKGSHDFTIQSGIRIHHTSFNKETLISPRIQASWKPYWKKDIVFKLATGIYNQPPFYRELRKLDGQLNTTLLSQKSIHFITGLDWQFKAMNEKPFRISAEAYFKSMTDVIPYDIENVKIKYLGQNNAKAYATGIEMRLFTELIKDAESWLSVGIMQTKENLKNDYYYDYLNASGDIITSQSLNQIPVDSVKREIGYLRRPSDRRVTVGLFLQDYLATNKNCRVHMNMIYGSNMPYNIPNSTRYRNGLIIDPYIRVDMGFSVLLLKEKINRKSHSPFRNYENIWLSLEVFNVINKANTISYQMIKDFANTIYAIPNQLTPRMLNLKIIARF